MDPSDGGMLRAVSNSIPLDGQQTRELMRFITLVTQNNRALLGLDSRPGSVRALSPVTDALPPTTEWLSEEVASNSAHLEDFFHRDRVRLPCDPFEPIVATPEVLQRLVEWTKDDSSGRLWIDGPTIEAEDVDNPLSILAAKFLDLASQSNVPTISYFCELRRGERPRSGVSRELQSVIALISAIIRQMIELLLPRFEVEIDLSEARFSLLDGRPESWGEAIAMVKDLTTLIPDKVLCIIDGLHWIDDRSTETKMRDLVQMLKGPHFKTLFTTTGRTSCLAKELPASETLSLDNRSMLRAIGGLDGQILEAKK